jgi:hypothetical protein
MRPQFENLRETLLRAGIAPRHVRHYTAELTNHLEDLANEERTKGHVFDNAEAVARSRLGTDEALAAALPAKPGLRSVTARMPWLVFGLGPFAMLLGTLVAAVFVEMGLIKIHLALTGLEHLWEWGALDAGMGAHVPGWLRGVVWVWNQAIIYAAPLATAGLLLVLGRRQRIACPWIILGMVLACFIGGFHDVSASWSDQPGKSELSAGFGLTPPGFWRAGVNLVLLGAATLLWQRRMSFAPVRS